jgi:hypothetical protein
MNQKIISLQFPQYHSVQVKRFVVQRFWSAVTYSRQNKHLYICAFNDSFTSPYFICNVITIFFIFLRTIQLAWILYSCRKYTND